MPSSACASHTRLLHSFPTRRSSDLVDGDVERAVDHHERRLAPRVGDDRSHIVASDLVQGGEQVVVVAAVRSVVPDVGAGRHAVDCLRSEEHTSELQSLRHLVCRLLLAPLTLDYSILSLHDALPIWSMVM